MADVEFWIQIENHPWDVAPNNIDRMTGRTIQQIHAGTAPVSKTLTSPVTGVTRTRTMYMPLAEDALILRRYTENWAAPDDRKVNPWDLNEKDPTDNGTMGTIPGPVIECKVGQSVAVHFRNKDHRAGKSAKVRAHSLHPHGFVFNVLYDGAFPLSPPDLSQPVGGEAGLWSAVSVSGFKQGDRVPPDGTFTYTWQTLGWPTTAGVWLYHDHSFCDTRNVTLGAIGIIVIHNEADPDDVIDQDLPGGQHNGRLIRLQCFPFPIEKLSPLPHDLIDLGRPLFELEETHEGPHEGLELHGGEEHEEPQEPPKRKRRPAAEQEQPIVERAFRLGDLILELDPDFKIIRRHCWRFYVDPPQKAQYLQLYHEMPGVGMLINGRKYLGNAPTVLAGLQTKMRFGLVGMNISAFHTFHLHGHRWTIPGPDGNTAVAIQGSVQNTAVSQFEDTRTFGPANSFAFTINQGSFMGAVRGADPPGLGEWHMHCHVLSHMHDGMMGSLLVVQPGQPAGPLPRGQHVDCGPVGDHDGDGAPKVTVQNTAFMPTVISVPSGGSLTFDFQETDHTVKTASTMGGASPISVNGGGGDLDDVAPVPQQRVVTISGPAGGKIFYQCGIHGPTMAGRIDIT